MSALPEDYSLELLDELQGDIGEGYSPRPEDQLIPIVYILQTGSPQCDKRGAAYVTRAEPGHFYLRGAIEPIRDGTVGIEVVPCGMVRTFLEWMPNRQGLVGRHDKPPSDVEIRTIKDGGFEKQSLVRSSNGDIIQDTREFYMLIDGAAFMLPCYGTRHTFARQWNSYFGQFKHPKTGGVMPSYSRRYQLSTVASANAIGHWFGLKFQDLGPNSVAALPAARELRDIVKRGAQRAELPAGDSGDALAREPALRLAPGAA